MRVKIEVPKEVVVSLLNGEHVASGYLESVLIDGVNKRNDDKARKKRLKVLGFDLSTKKRVSCSRCEVVSVNGAAHHERDCPNEYPPADYEQWADS
jgi:hypothetical protein